MDITVLGEPTIKSPKRHFINDSYRLPNIIIKGQPSTAEDELFFELAGPREKLYFDPKSTKVGIVTCGGLCPGLNDVVRSLFLELYHAYGVKEVYGFRGGYQGLDPKRGREPILLTPGLVDGIHKDGGTMLGTSRGPVDTGLAVEFDKTRDQCPLYSGWEWHPARRE